MPLTVAIPTINDTKFDFEKLYKIYQACITTNEDIVFDFSNCHFIRQNATAFIIGLKFRIQRQRRNATIFWGNCASVVRSNLARNGFTRFFNLEYLPYGANTIETRWFSEVNDEEKVVSYLADNWLGRGWLNISPDLVGAIIGNVYELFANSFEHSKSIIGVLTSGQHYPNRHELALSVVDFGVGIPGNVRRHLGKPTLSAKDAFLWALKRGNSTRVGAPGGLGLDMLREFLAINNGEMAVYSRDGYFRWYGSNEQYGEMPLDFHGTIVNLKLKCDNRFYRLA